MTRFALHIWDEPEKPAEPSLIAKIVECGGKIVAQKPHDNGWTIEVEVEDLDTFSPRWAEVLADL